MTPVEEHAEALVMHLEAATGRKLDAYARGIIFQFIADASDVRERDPAYVRPAIEREAADT